MNEVVKTNFPTRNVLLFNESWKKAPKIFNGFLKTFILSLKQATIDKNRRISETQAVSLILNHLHRDRLSFCSFGNCFRNFSIVASEMRGQP